MGKFGRGLLELCVEMYPYVTADIAGRKLFAEMPIGSCYEFL